MQLVLASTSPRRQHMLEALKIQFTVMAPHAEAEKSLPRHLPLARLQQLLPEVSEGKARDVAERCQAYSLVVAADTVVYCQGQVLGKPGGTLVARRYLEKLSGRAHRVLSSVTVHDTQTNLVHSAVEVTEVRFRKLSEREIERYIASGEPMDKAGSYGIQGWGGLLVESIKGRHDNVVGFPLATLEEVLKTFGRSLYDFARV
jgi:septum formation protein